ncbi:ribonuclease H-like domain-containing protein [Tanacetum coccineum]
MPGNSLNFKLDVSHPLHLHPNDSVALTVVSVKLKGTENYQVWSCAMLLALEGKNKTRFIDGSCRRSNTDEVLRRQWDRVNVVVLGETLPDVRSAYAIGLLLVVCLEPLKGLRLLLLMSMLLTKGTFRGHKPLLVSQGLLMIIDLMIMGIGELLGFYFDL